MHPIPARNRFQEADEQCWYGVKVMRILGKYRRDGKHQVLWLRAFKDAQDRYVPWNYRVFGQVDGAAECALIEPEAWKTRDGLIQYAS
jgi:hypothetical protein